MQEQCGGFLVLYCYCTTKARTTYDGISQPLGLRAASSTYKIFFLPLHHLGRRFPRSHQCSVSGTNHHHDEAPSQAPESLSAPAACAGDARRVQRRPPPPRLCVQAYSSSPAGAIPHGRDVPVANLRLRAHARVPRRLGNRPRDAHERRRGRVRGAGPRVHGQGRLGVQDRGRRGGRQLCGRHEAGVWQGREVYGCEFFSPSLCFSPSRQDGRGVCLCTCVC